MKPVRFLGDSLQCVRDFPVDARQDAGYQLDKVQRGLQPDDFGLLLGPAALVDYDYTMRRSVAQRLSSWRLESWSLRSTADAWVSTVFTEIVSSRASSL